MLDTPAVFDLEELTREAARLLDRFALTSAQSDARISAVPDVRTIRYYTSLGLLDRPSIQGRQARYGRRHLLQLLAIKALQAASLPLSEIQARLYGRSDDELEALLDSLSQRVPVERRKEEAIRPIIWQEIVVEPGLKLMIDQNWKPQANARTTEERLRAVLSYLEGTGSSDNGGDRNDVTA